MYEVSFQKSCIFSYVYITNIIERRKYNKFYKTNHLIIRMRK